MKIQRFELNHFAEHAIFCPFCGQKVVDYEATQEGENEEMVQPCGHTLFVGHDEGFEYRSPQFDTDLDLEGLEYGDSGFPDVDVDALTDEVSIQDSLKFALYVGAPSGFGSYVGFAPSTEDQAGEQDAEQTGPEHVYVATVLGPGGMGGGLVASTWGFVGIEPTAAVISGLVAASSGDGPQPLPGCGYLQRQSAGQSPVVEQLRELRRGDSAFVDGGKWVASPLDFYTWKAHPKGKRRESSERLRKLAIRAEEGEDVKPSAPRAELTPEEVLVLRLEYAFESRDTDHLVQIFDSAPWRRELKAVLRRTRGDWRGDRPSIPSAGRGRELLLRALKSLEAEGRELAQELLDRL